MIIIKVGIIKNLKLKKTAATIEKSESDEKYSSEGFSDYILRVVEEDQHYKNWEPIESYLF